MNDCLVIDGYRLDSVKAVDAFIDLVDEKLIREWGRPLLPSAVEIIYKHAQETTKCESIRAEIDARIRQLNHIEAPTEELEQEWRKREEMARFWGYDVEVSPSPEQRRKLEEIWRKREEEAGKL